MWTTQNCGLQADVFLASSGMTPSEETVFDRGNTVQLSSLAAALGGLPTVVDSTSVPEGAWPDSRDVDCGTASVSPSTVLASASTSAPSRAGAVSLLLSMAWLSWSTDLLREVSIVLLLLLDRTWSIASATLGTIFCKEALRGMWTCTKDCKSTRTKQRSISPHHGSPETRKFIRQWSKDVALAPAPVSQKVPMVLNAKTMTLTGCWKLDCPRSGAPCQHTCLPHRPGECLFYIGSSICCPQVTISHREYNNSMASNCHCHLATCKDKYRLIFNISQSR